LVDIFLILGTEMSFGTVVVILVNSVRHETNYLMKQSGIAEC